jgi:hypothetical protein
VYVFSEDIAIKVRDDGLGLVGNRYQQEIMWPANYEWLGNHLAFDIGEKCLTSLAQLESRDVIGAKVVQERGAVVTLDGHTGPVW